MLIAIDCRALLIPMTGIGRYTQQFVVHLKEEVDPHEVKLLYILGAGFGATWEPVEARARLNHVRTRHIQTVWECTVLPALLWRYRVDVFHSPRNYSLPPFRVVPTVVTVHDAIPILFPAPDPLGALTRLRLRRAARLADAIITVSECSRRDIVNHLGVPPEKVRVVPLAPSELFRQPSDRAYLEELRRRFGIGDRFVLATGATEPRKNVRLLTAIWSEVVGRVGAAVDLVIVGPPWPGRPIPAALPRNVCYTGALDDPEVAALMRGAELFVFPSLYEGFGLPVLEAMAAGVPVVASNTSALPEVVGDAGILLPPDEPRLWVEAIVRLLKDQARRRELACKGLHRAAQFDWRRTTRETVRVYREVWAKYARGQRRTGAPRRSG